MQERYGKMQPMTAQPWEPRVSRLEGAFEQLDKRLGSIEGALRDLRREMNQRFDRVDSRFNQLLATMITSRLVIIGIVIGFFESIRSHLAR